MMYLSRHDSPSGPRWAVDGNLLPPSVTLALLLELPAPAIPQALAAFGRSDPAEGALLAPVETAQEVWAAGVTYLRSRQARQEESAAADVYQRVYEAPRPELFLKAPGWRVVGHGRPVRVRRDSRWNVPEPELTLVVNCHGEIVGYCAGNDVSSRDIEGENPLYLPQAKVYNRSCALGPGIVLAGPEAMRALTIRLHVQRAGQVIFEGETCSDRMARPLEELAAYLVRELDLPYGGFLMTGTGIVPGDDFTLTPGDVVTVEVGELALENPVAA